MYGHRCLVDDCIEKELILIGIKVILVKIVLYPFILNVLYHLVGNIIIVSLSSWLYDRGENECRLFSFQICDYVREWWLLLFFLNQKILLKNGIPWIFLRKNNSSLNDYGAQIIFKIVNQTPERDILILFSKRKR